jgi:hypothetical protein
MSNIKTDSTINHAVSGRSGMSALLLGSLATVAFGSLPVDPLPPPLFSFDLDSPSVLEGFVEPNAVLALDFPHPQTVLTGPAIGLPDEADELNAISAANQQLSTDASFAILFSVDRETVGVATPNPNLAALGVPYNVFDQAARGQAAGDQFMSTALFTRAEGLTSTTFAFNNTLVRNNFNEGGTDFAAEPFTSAAAVAVDDPEDCVDATMFSGVDGTPLYYSAGSASPSLGSLPVYMAPSGAHVYFTPMAYGEPVLFASFVDLGLQEEDDIDALLVFDTNANAVFDGADQVLFSLTPGSPSLLSIPDASVTGAAADVFVAAPGEAPAVFASAGDLGLGDALDNVNALDYTLCDDAETCAAAHGIRYIPGDFDHDGDVDGEDYTEFAQCFSGGGIAAAAGCEAGDFDEDQDVDCDDWAAFCDAWTAGGDPPPLPPCDGQGGIPTVSEWGMVIAMLLALAGGTLIFDKRQTKSALAAKSLS